MRSCDIFANRRADGAIKQCLTYVSAYGLSPGRRLGDGADLVPPSAKRRSPRFFEGVWVVDRDGQMLGRLRNTGYGPPGERDQFPPHLHFGIQVGIQWVDPYGTLVSLYDAAVKADTRAQASLDALAAAGKRSAWQREASKMFTAFGG